MSATSGSGQTYEELKTCGYSTNVKDLLADKRRATCFHGNWSSSGYAVFCLLGLEYSYKTTM